MSQPLPRRFSFVSTSRGARLRLHGIARRRVGLGAGVPWVLVRRSHELEPHRDDSAVHAELGHERTYESRPQFVEIRPVAACDRNPDRVAQDFSENRNLGSTTLYRFGRELVRREHEVGAELVADADAS
jgi:hypothetical protein